MTRTRARNSRMSVMVARYFTWAGLKHRTAVADVVTHRRALRRGRPERADRRLRYGRLRRLLAFESRLRRPERRSCLLTAPTSLEMSVNTARHQSRPPTT